MSAGDLFAPAEGQAPDPRLHSLIVHFLLPMAKVYDPPKHADSDDSLRRAIEVLAKTVADQVPLITKEDAERAWNRVASDFDGRGWPRPKRIINAIRDAQTFRPDDHNPKASMKRRWEYVAERVPKLVADWQLGFPEEWQRARDEGWGQALFDFLRSEAWGVAQTEFLKGDRRQLMIGVDYEAPIKGHIESCRRLIADEARRGRGRDLLPDIVRTDATVRQQWLAVERARNRWLPPDLRYPDPDAQPVPPAPGAEPLPARAFERDLDSLGDQL